MKTTSTQKSTLKKQKAYFELSKKKVLEQYKLATTLADIVSYSSKTNPEVTPILEKETNAFFNIHIENELKNVHDLSRVFFIGQGWDDELISELLSKGCNKFIVDNEVDLAVLEESLQNKKTPIELLLRIKLKENSIRTERHFVYGMSSKIINKKIKELSTNPNIKTLGVHFHRKTQNMAEWNLQYEIENMLTKETLQIISVLDIGGGLPSEYANTNVKVMNGIFKKIKELKQWLNAQKIKLMIEPGRFICAPSTTLVSFVKSVYDNNIIVNTSTYNGDTDAFIVPTKLLVKGELEKGNGEPYVIKGIIPCSLDIFRYRVYLKERPKRGDKIVFLNAGAYNFASDFCDLEKLETKIID